MSVPDWMIDNPSPSVDDMAALIRRLVRSLRKAAPGNALADQALDYLARVGMTGEIMRAPAEAPANEGGWLRAVDEEMVSTHLGVADAADDYDTAKRKLSDLIAWHVSVATDPNLAAPAQGAAVPDAEIAALRDKHGITCSGRGIKGFEQIRAFVDDALRAARQKGGV